MIPEETFDYNIKKTWTKINKMYHDIASKYMGSTSLAMILLNIDIFEGTPSTKLGPIIGIESTSLSRSLNKLEELGVIYRKNDSNDKRKVLIHLTELGKERRDLAKKIVLDFNERIIANFEQSEIDNFFKVIKGINKIADSK